MHGNVAYRALLSARLKVRMVVNLERNVVNLRNLTAVTFTTSSQSCNQNPGNDECVTQYNLCYYILKFLKNHVTFLSGFENQKEKLIENGKSS